MANTIVPNPPYNNKVIDPKTGLVDPAWLHWFKVVFIRIGGSDAPSNSSIQSGVDSLNPTVTTLQNSVNILQAEIDGLGQGRQL